MSRPQRAQMHLRGSLDASAALAATGMTVRGRILTPGVYTPVVNGKGMRVRFRKEVILDAFRKLRARVAAGMVEMRLSHPNVGDMPLKWGTATQVKADLQKGEVWLTDSTPAPEMAAILTAEARKKLQDLGLSVASNTRFRRAEGDEKEEFDLDALDMDIDAIDIVREGAFAGSEITNEVPVGLMAQRSHAMAQSESARGMSTRGLHAEKASDLLRGPNDIPANVRGHMTTTQQSVYVNVYNDALRYGSSPSDAATQAFESASRYKTDADPVRGYEKLARPRSDYLPSKKGKTRAEDDDPDSADTSAKRTKRTRAEDSDTDADPDSAGDYVGAKKKRTRAEDGDDGAEAGDDVNAEDADDTDVDTTAEDDDADADTTAKRGRKGTRAKNNDYAPKGATSRAKAAAKRASALRAQAEAIEIEAGIRAQRATTHDEDSPDFEAELAARDAKLDELHEIVAELQAKNQAAEKRLANEAAQRDVEWAILTARKATPAEKDTLLKVRAKLGSADFREMMRARSTVAPPPGEMGASRDMLAASETKTPSDEASDAVQKYGVEGVIGAGLTDPRLVGDAAAKAMRAHLATNYGDDPLVRSRFSAEVAAMRAKKANKEGDA